MCLEAQFGSRAKLLEGREYVHRMRTDGGEDPAVAFAGRRRREL